MTAVETVPDGTLSRMLSDVFARHRERLGTPAVCDAELWQQLCELGLARLTGSEERGGSGAGWLEAAEMLRAAAYHGVRVPLPEHDLLAGWLLETAGIETDDARRTTCLLENGQAASVPWASWAEKIVAVWNEDGIWRVADTNALAVAPGVGIAGEPRDVVSGTPATGTSIPEAVVRELFRRGALARAVQICAALDRVLELSVAHVTVRRQFGRPISKFQAVQQQIVDLAAEAALARAATEAALHDAFELGFGSPSVGYRIAVARSCAGHAVATVVRNAHQIHGAIGTTREHRLHEFTLSALAWRSEFGTVHYWDSMLTDIAVTAGSGGLWPLVASGGITAG